MLMDGASSQHGAAPQTTPAPKERPKLLQSRTDPGAVGAPSWVGSEAGRSERRAATRSLCTALTPSK